MSRRQPSRGRRVATECFERKDAFVGQTGDGEKPSPWKRVETPPLTKGGLSLGASGAPLSVSERVRANRPRTSEPDEAVHVRPRGIARKTALDEGVCVAPSLIVLVFDSCSCAHRGSGH